MNFEQLNANKEVILKILENSLIDPEEKEFRKGRILTICDSMKASGKIDNRYYSFAHEIRSLEFLEKRGKVRIANDSKNESGCDFKMNSYYQIECVCSSSGNETINGLDKFKGYGFFDYNEKENIILTRITQSIEAKIKFYHEHVRKGTIDKDKPYIIFLSLGDLSSEMFLDRFAFEFNKILFGIGFKRLYIREEKVIGKDYSHNAYIFKHNGSEIECNYFNTAKYAFLSAIIFSAAPLEQVYGKENTFLFINPHSKHKIKVNDFRGITFWKKVKDEYAPYTDDKF